jgi:inorganic phosphate transporter, PiT family
MVLRNALLQFPFADRLDVGVSLVYTLTRSKQGEGIHWDQAGQLLLSLLISPVVGFGAAALILLALHRFVKTPRLFEPADPEKSPPHWVRGVLIATCTGVSFAHGSNDRTKRNGTVDAGAHRGASFLPRLEFGHEARRLTKTHHRARTRSPCFKTQVTEKKPPAKEQAKSALTEYNTPKGEFREAVFPALIAELEDLRANFTGKNSIAQIPLQERPAQRQSAFLAQETLKKLAKEKRIGAKDMEPLRESLKKTVEYIPIWVKAAVALSLGLGTMIGWRRIVTTVAERIGKTHLAYAQGAAAELTTMGTIFLADNFGLPVSTTHVLTSGIAGTMFANRSGLQKSTLRNIVIAWVLTLPACFFLGATIFAGMLYLFFNVLGWK